jgi:hypothetical protein
MKAQVNAQPNTSERWTHPRYPLYRRVVILNEVKDLLFLCPCERDRPSREFSRKQVNLSTKAKT